MSDSMQIRIIHTRHFQYAISPDTSLSFWRSPGSGLEMTPWFVAWCGGWLGHCRSCGGSGVVTNSNIFRDILQSRVNVKKRDFYKHTMQVCDYSSWRWFGTSVPIETHMTRLCIYKSEVEGTLIRRVSSKRPSRVRDRDNIVDEKDCKWTCHPLRGYWFAFQANQWFSKS